MDTINFIGTIHSSLKEISDCPLQENEGAPPVGISIDLKYREGLLGLEVGAKIILLTWLHKADRTVLTTKPRNNPHAETAGVFATRSPNRPNPIGIHTSEILQITNSGDIKISNLEVIDGTPVIDIKPVI
jgi:tRNA-Thr(GGU) m(6)t(6)A37 methyltransferase TsaA